MKWIHKVNEKEVKRTIINCSDNKIFDNQISLDHAIEQVKDKYTFTGRDYFIGQLFGLSNEKVPEAAKEPKKKRTSKRKHR